MNSTRAHPEGVGCARGAFHVRASLLRSHGSIGVAVGYCEGLHCGQRVMVPAHATPVSRSATVSNVSALVWHVLHGWVLMVPGDSSRRSVSSIVTIAYVGLFCDEVDHAFFCLARV